MPTKLVSPARLLPTPFVLPPDNPIPGQLALFRVEAEAAVRGRQLSAAASGFPGCGKSQIVIELLTRFKVPWAKPTTWREFVEAAYRLRDRGVIFVDDRDNLIIRGGIDQANKIKAFLNGKPGEARLFVNDTQEARKAAKSEDAAFAIPIRFFTRAVLIWCTNTNLDAASKAMLEHMPALVSRGLSPVRVSSDRMHALEYILDLIINRNLLSTVKQAKLAEAQDVIDFLCEFVWCFETLSIRTALETIAKRRDAPETWRASLINRWQLTRENAPTEPVSDKPAPAPPRMLTNKERLDRGMLVPGKPYQELPDPVIYTLEEIENGAGADDTEPMPTKPRSRPATTTAGPADVVAEDADEHPIDPLMPSDDEDAETAPDDTKGRKTGIEWTTITWNPVTGCEAVSPGCDHCYAKSMATRLAGVKTSPYYGIGFDVTLRPERLGDPMTWKKPQRVFVNSMSDLWHKDVPDEYLDCVFGVMERETRHTYQVLTKRHVRMMRYINNRYPEGTTVPAHIWIGVSIEDQQRAVRLQFLKDARAAVRFVSAEPLIGAVELNLTGIAWLIAGGESGGGARQMKAEWARSLRDQCIKYGTKFFFKQWGRYGPDGERHPNKKDAGRELDGRKREEYPAAA